MIISIGINSAMGTQRSVFSLRGQPRSLRDMTSRLTLQGFSTAFLRPPPTSCFCKLVLETALSLLDGDLGRMPASRVTDLLSGQCILLGVDASA